MEFNELLQLSGVILGALGGGSALVLSFSSFFGKLWANTLMEKEKANHARELEVLRGSLTKHSESYKVKLKKSEFIFEKQYVAASEFVALLMRIKPKPMHFLEEDEEWWNDYDMVEKRSLEMEKELSNFVKLNGAILDDNSKRQIDNCIRKAIELRYSKSYLNDTFSGSDLRSLYSVLEELENHLICTFFEQSST
ncbi:hypothetical protein C4G66_RS23670 [Vibrio parahaemolyticus]|nr:hypothetical protein [Vibrio parahaemolyticus]EJG1071763.1 hypothetical protein [Vibrio parahaemolyticus]HCG9740662.1 hypothetical protein [Vibrio parahaemolyticus]